MSPPYSDVVRPEPMRRNLSDADRYVRWEYGAPDATWLLWAHQAPHEADPPCETPSNEGLLRRLTQALASFLF
ncbi:MAG TPA: hypothetical protein VJN63_09085 [Thermoplasmata archaeon]|nr:hypothetical protein [Thermoplasmata archaeon]